MEVMSEIIRQKPAHLVEVTLTKACQIVNNYLELSWGAGRNGSYDKGRHALERGKQLAIASPLVIWSLTIVEEVGTQDGSLVFAVLWLLVSYLY